MAKESSGGFSNFANLWGKPLPGVVSKAEPAPKAKKEPARMSPEEDEDLDVADVTAEEESETDTIAAEDLDELEEETGDGEIAAEVDEEDSTEEEEDEDEEENQQDELPDDVLERNLKNAHIYYDTCKTAPTAACTTEKVTDMPATKKTNADYVRDEIKKRQESGASLRGVDIVAAMAAKKITVSAAQVSQLLKKAGVAQVARPRTTETAAVPAARPRMAKMLNDRHLNLTATKTPPSDRVPATRPATIKKAEHTMVGSTDAAAVTFTLAEMKAAHAYLMSCDGSYETAAARLDALKQVSTLT